MASDWCWKLEWRVRGLGVGLQEEDEPKALENERKKTSTQGNNILGVKKKETKALFYSEVWGTERF